MLNELKIDELLSKVDSRYGLVLASARRARQINEYAATLGLNESLGIPGPQVHTRSQHPLSIALEELREDRLNIGLKSRPGPEYAPAPEEEDTADPVAEEAAGEGILTDEDPQAKAPEEADEELNSDRGVTESPEEGGSEDEGSDASSEGEDEGPGAA
ncbi:DNA-directed RNA polymerase subunit omega [Rubrobacter aplysinae]|uniref:DNA-directed RNA polymerase subunit omega n=1 Tax=Rubrobacter aplysinae TaxID=909625 RepID=UPI000A00DF6D|nr:DNA-directed RNA polymerase subunit omega [Rubrobacter aplysinae]